MADRGLYPTQARGAGYNDAHFEHRPNFPTSEIRGWFKKTCFREGYWVVVIKQFDPAKNKEFGDDIVTAFVRKSAKSVDDVIRYLQSAGYGL